MVAEAARAPRSPLEVVALVAASVAPGCPLRATIASSLAETRSATAALLWSQLHRTRPLTPALLADPCDRHDLTDMLSSSRLSERGLWGSLTPGRLRALYICPGAKGVCAQEVLPTDDGPSISV